MKVISSRDSDSSGALHPGAGKMIDRSRARYEDGEQGQREGGDLRPLLPLGRTVFPALASQATSLVRDVVGWTAFPSVAWYGCCALPT